MSQIVRSEVDGGEEVTSSLIVAGGDGAEEFEFGEEVLDQVAGFVEVLVVDGGLLIGFGGGMTASFPAFCKGWRTRWSASKPLSAITDRPRSAARARRRRPGRGPALR